LLDACVGVFFLKIFRNIIIENSYSKPDSLQS
jgi:hypothetical protein